MTKTKTLEYNSNRLLASVALVSSLFLHKPLYAEQTTPNQASSVSDKQVKQFSTVINLKEFLKQCKLPECAKILKKVSSEKLLITLKFDYALVKSAVKDPNGFSDTFFDIFVSRINLNPDEASLFAPTYNELSAYILKYCFPGIVKQMNDYLKIMNANNSSVAVAPKPVLLPANKEPLKAPVVVVKPKIPIEQSPSSNSVNLRGDPFSLSRLTDRRFVLANSFSYNDFSLTADQQSNTTTDQTSLLSWILYGQKLQVGLNSVFGFGSADQSLSAGNCNGLAVCMSTNINNYYLVGGGPALRFILNSGSTQLKTFVNINALYRPSFDVSSSDQNVMYERMTVASFPSRLLVDFDVLHTISLGSFDIIRLLLRFSTQHSSFLNDASLTVDFSKLHASIDYTVIHPPSASLTVPGTIDFESSTIRSLDLAFDYRILDFLSVGAGANLTSSKINSTNDSGLLVNYAGPLARVLIQIGPVIISTDGVYYPSSSDFAVISSLNLSFGKGRYFTGTRVSHTLFDRSIEIVSHLAY